jgi:photosystem II stability/assembly factor-like uncharacterized protein
MKRNSINLAACAVLLLALFSDTTRIKSDGTAEAAKGKPNDWFLLQRSFPYPEINYTARDMAWQQAKQAKASIQASSRGTGWSLGGPLNIGGRISALAMHPDNMQTIYAGAASGGIFKSTNSGQTWSAIFEDAASLSIGDIAIANTDPDLVWVGTGEANAGGGSMTYDGDGVYKSLDGGGTWQHAGLVNIGSVGRLAIHPTDPQTVFVAAMGRLFSNNPDRGVFRTSDGGATWEKVLYLNDSTGAIDIVIHPQHPDTIYAAMWERVRTPDRRTYGGPGSGIFRSYDGGDTWTRLAGGLPVSSAYVGRIGLDISSSDPGVLYAIYADDIGYFSGVYRSANGGDSWTRTNDGALANFYSSYGWWFGRIVVDPSNANIAYAIGFDLYKTTNGGNSWSYISGPVHVDQHDLVVHPLNTNYLVLGNDGGVYLSSNAGSSWTFLDNLPITQFYTCEADEQFPERLYGGTQDNGTNRTFAAGLGDWESIYWGDGFYVLVDPTNNNYIYAEYQYGNFARSTNGGASFSTAMTGISTSDRMNWNTPFIIDPNNPQVLYFGANRLYKSTNRASSWQAVSTDLTNGAGNFNQVYGTITTIAVAPSNSQYIYVGTDDGNAWRTVNGGTNWVKITGGLPERWITRVSVDPNEENTVYITLSGYKYDSYQPHIFRSTSAGTIWTDISGNLPEAPVNDVIVDPALDSTLYAATDFGVFVTRDLGLHWQMLGDNLPNVPVVDLRFHAPTRTLVAATYGRSMYTFDLDQLVSYPEFAGKDESFRIFPNPASGRINIIFSGLNSEGQYRIISSSGQEVKTGWLNQARGVQTISIDELSSGYYFLEITENGLLIGIEKIVVSN